VPPSFGTCGESRLLSADPWSISAIVLWEVARLARASTRLDVPGLSGGRADWRDERRTEHSTRDARSCAAQVQGDPARAVSATPLRCRLVSYAPRRPPGASAMSWKGPVDASRVRVRRVRTSRGAIRVPSAQGTLMQLRDWGKSCGRPSSEWRRDRRPRRSIQAGLM
jgi:hypothetical protein